MQRLILTGGEPVSDLEIGEALVFPGGQRVLSFSLDCICGVGTAFLGRGGGGPAEVELTSHFSSHSNVCLTLLC